MKVYSITVNLPDDSFVELKPKETQHVTLALAEAKAEYPLWTSMVIVVVPTSEDKR